MIRQILIAVFLFAVVLKCSLVVFSMVNALVAVISALITYLEAKKMIGYRIAEILADLYKPIAASAVMWLALCAAGRMLDAHIASVLVLLVGKLLIGAGVYLVLALVMKMDGVHEILDVFRKLRKRG